MDVEGWVPVCDVLALKEFEHLGIGDIEHVVHSNEKCRFSLKCEVVKLPSGAKKDVQFIRANQGHSLDLVDPFRIWAPIDSPSQIRVCIHGTYWSCWPQISTMGISKMKRNAIHFAPGMPGEDGVISGMRRSAELMIFIDVERAMSDGIKFFRSENLVILSQGLNGVIGTKYFSRVVEKKGRAIIPPVHTATTASMSQQPQLL